MKILSVLIAFVLWVYVIVVENPPTPQTIQNIPIELLNVETLTQNGLTILDVDRETVSVTVRGTRADIAQYKDQITATANVFGYPIGANNNVPIIVTPPPGLIVEEVRPARIRVNIERLVSVYSPINITFSGDILPNTEPGSMTMQPEQIEIRGPESLIESVSYVGVEVPYQELSRSGSTLTLPVNVLDANEGPIPNISLSSETVNVEVTLYDTKEVPLLIEITGEISEIYEITRLDIPETIKVRGSASALAGVVLIEAEPIDVSDVNITSELPVRPILPQGVELARGSSNIHVNIDIKGISNNSFEYNSPEIGIHGLRDGLNAYINTPTLILKAAGNEEVISVAGKEDFRLFVDLQGLSQGTHVVPVIVSHDHDSTLNNQVLTPGEVHITISGGP
jgi:YbbR domain-containing protein